MSVLKQEGGWLSLPEPGNTASPLTGAMGSLCMDGDEASTSEDVSKWTVEDVCSFVEGLSGCSEYARVRGTPGTVEMEGARGAEAGH